MPTHNDMSVVRSWAYTHPAAARWLISVIFLIAGFGGFFYGLFVIGTSWYEAGWPIWISLAALAGTIAVRIAWKGKAPNSSSWVIFHITMMFIFVSVSGYLGSRFPVKYGGNWNGSAFDQAYAASSAPETLSFSEEFNTLSETAGKNPSWLQKKLQKARKSVNEMPVAVKILLTLLIVVGVIFLGYIVGALACVLACNDLAVLAVGLVVAGWGLLIWGSIVLMIRLWRKNARQKAKAKARLS
ncbi:MAG: hypothetical protein R3D00_22315 [Bacteroidia bacterium]